MQFARVGFFVLMKIYNSMIAKYTIDRKINLLAEVFYGEIYFNDIAKVRKEQKIDAGFGSVVKVITDLRLANLLLKPIQLTQYANEMKKQIDASKMIFAIVVNDPHSTALSYIFKDVPFFTNKTGVFSTIEAANDFLMLNLNQQVLDTYDYTIVG